MTLYENRDVKISTIQFITCPKNGFIETLFRCKQCGYHLKIIDDIEDPIVVCEWRD